MIRFGPVNNIDESSAVVTELGALNTGAVSTFTTSISVYSLLDKWPLVSFTTHWTLLMPVVGFSRVSVYVTCSSIVSYWALEAVPVIVRVPVAELQLDETPLGNVNPSAMPSKSSLLL